MTAADVLDERELGRSASRLPALDGLRSMVLLVMLAHFGNFDHPLPGAWLQRGFLLTAQTAFVGLDVFFVLSGFLITRILLDAKGTSTYFRNFYFRRALRIFPLYYGFLILYLVVLPRYVPWAAEGSANAGLPFWFYLQNIAFSGLWELPNNAYLGSIGHLWSLAVEEQYYLVWPLVVYLCTPRRLKIACLVCIGATLALRFALVMAGVGGSASVVYALTPTRMDGLALGSLIAVLAREPGRLALLRPWARRIAPISFAVLMVVVLPQDEHGSHSRLFHTVGVTASVYTAASLFVLTLLAGPTNLWSRFLSSRPLRYLGQRSYGIYVFHLPVAYVVARSGILATPWLDSVIPRPLFIELARTVILMAISIALAALSWRFFERPILARRHRIGSRVTRADIQASPIG